jgi:hypothetical protein
MSTQQQIEANRRNAARSTGPRTPDGKARAAQNALRHGLTSRRLVLRDEEEEAFLEFRAALSAELRPLSTLETALVTRVAAQLWRLARVPAIEAGLFERLRSFALGGDEGLGGAFARDALVGEGAFSKLARYESTLERSVSRLLSELRRAQAARTGRSAREALPRREERRYAPAVAVDRGSLHPEWFRPRDPRSVPYVDRAAGNGRDPAPAEGAAPASPAAEPARVPHSRPDTSTVPVPSAAAGNGRNPVSAEGAPVSPAAEFAGAPPSRPDIETVPAPEPSVGNGRDPAWAEPTEPALPATPPDPGAPAAPANGSGRGSSRNSGG